MTAANGLELAHVPMGSQAGADPTENPRWDGERIRPYDNVDEHVLWTLDDGWSDDR